jgi:hypothetical protein
MKKQILILSTIITFILCSCNNCPSNKDIIESWDNGHSKKEILWADKQDSTYIETTYFESGQKKLERIISKGQLEKLTGYYETGELSGMFIYLNDEPVAGAEYYKNGQKRGLVPRNLNGKLNGRIKYYFENGIVSLEGDAKEDQRDGTWTEFDEEGNLISEILWNNGKKVPKDNIAGAQNFFKKLYSPNCSEPDATRTVTSKFYKIEIKLPTSWIGDFEGELPSLNVTRKIKDKSYHIRLGSSYDSVGIFGWAKENLKPNTFEIVTIKGVEILIECPFKNRSSYMITFLQDPGTDNLWLWRMEIIGAIGYEKDVVCDVTFLLEQLIKKK